MHGMCLEWSGSDEEIESKVSAEGGDEHGDVEDMHYLYVQPKEHDSDAEPFPNDSQCVDDTAHGHIEYCECSGKFGSDYAAGSADVLMFERSVWKCTRDAESLRL